MENQSFKMKRVKIKYCSILLMLLSVIQVGAQDKNTNINGFVSTLVSYDMDQDNFSFGIGNQSTVITSNLSDRVSFLGESIFAFVGNNSPTKFSVYLDRIQVKYNYWGNHDVLIGKFHTPVNYWNCLNSCHAMLFYPTITRPKLFSFKLIPIHETGISFRGEYLTNLNLGYDITIGNGMGASFVSDNDKTKSLLLTGYLNPIDGLRVGGSYYKDRIAIGINAPSGILPHPIDFSIYSATLAYFKNNIEFLSEFSISNAEQDVDEGGNQTAIGYFGYAGYKMGKFIPYLRFDNLDFDNKAVYYNYIDQQDLIIGLRYEVNYLALLKLEYAMGNVGVKDMEQTNKIYFQVAIGF